MNLNKLARNGLAAIAVAASTAFAPVQAAPVISLNLSTNNIQVGQVLGVDINVSGLSQALGGFAFDVDYDGTRLSFFFALADPDTKMGDASHPADDYGVPYATSGPVRFDLLAGFFLLDDEVTLAGLQGTGFTMGRLELTATNNPGFASLSVSGISLSDYGGLSIDGVTARGARVCVSPDGQTSCDSNQVPEPMTAWLAGIALGGLALTRRPRRKAV